MAKARDTLAACLEEAVRLATPSGRVSIDGERYVPAGRLQAVLLLARDALVAGDGDIADDRVRESGLSPETLSALGIEPRA